ncbi:MAG: hypothetical protein QW227_02745 [Candidatus Aenigmatarchaeota archaeon]
MDPFKEARQRPDGSPVEVSEDYQRIERMLSGLEKEFMLPPDLEKKVAETQGNKVELAYLAVNLGGQNGMKVLDVLMEACHNNYERAYYALFVASISQDRILKNYAITLRVEYFPEGLKKLLTKDTKNVNVAYMLLLREQVGL